MSSAHRHLYLLTLKRKHVVTLYFIKPHKLAFGSSFDLQLAADGRSGELSRDFNACVERLRAKSFCVPRLEEAPYLKI